MPHVKLSRKEFFYKIQICKSYQHLNQLSFQKEHFFPNKPSFISFGNNTWLLYQNIPEYSLLYFCQKGLIQCLGKLRVCIVWQHPSCSPVTSIIKTRKHCLLWRNLIPTFENTITSVLLYMIFFNGLLQYFI